MIPYCCEKKTSEKSVIKQIVFRNICSCNQFNNEVNEFENSFEEEGVNMQKQIITKVIRNYFESVEKVVEAPKFLFFGKEIPFNRPQLNNFVGNCKVLTFLERQFFNKILKSNLKISELVFFVCSNVPEQLRSDFIFIWASVLEIYLSLQKVLRTNDFQHYSKEVEGQILKKFGFFSNALTSIKPKVQSNKSTVEIDFKKFLAEFILNILASFLEHYEIPKIQEVDNNKM